MNTPALEIRRVPASDLHASPTNPRKHFDAEALRELADSIAEQGVRIPLLARPSPTQEDKLEIVAGERRFRATALAYEKVYLDGEPSPEVRDRVSLLPVIVEDLSDETVLELQLLENLQRADLTPIEEARGYAALLALPDYNAVKISAKIGKPLSIVRKRLQLLRAPESLQAALEEGRVSAKVLLLVATIPTEKGRKTAAKTVLSDPDRSFEDVRFIIEREFRVSLRSAPFALDDAELDRSAGPCVSCPHYAEKAAKDNPDLEGEIGYEQGKTHPQTCLSPECYQRKVKAHAERRKEQAEQEKSRVLEESKSRTVLDANGRLKPAFVDMEDKLPFEIVHHYNPDRPTWKDCVPDLPPASLIVVDPGNGVLMEVVEKRIAIEQAAKGPHAELFESVPASNGNHVPEPSLLPEQDAREKEKQAREKKIDALSRDLVLPILAEAAQKKGMDRDASLVLLDLALRESGMDGCRLIAGWLELEPKAPQGESLNQTHYRLAILEFVRDRDSAKNEVDVFLLLALVARWVKIYGPEADILAPVYKWSGIDAKTIKAHAKGQVLEEEKAAKARAKAKEKKKPSASKEEKINLQALDELTKAADQRNALPRKSLGGEPAATPGLSREEVEEYEASPKSVLAMSPEQLDLAARVIASGEEPYATFLGTTPNRKAPGYKEHERARVKLWKRVRKIQNAQA